MSKHTILVALLDVEMSKKCTVLWREAHLEVKRLKARGFGPLFEDSKVRDADVQVKTAKS